MPISLPLQVVQLTPPGRGAVATLRVEGPNAAATVQACFHTRNSQPLTACPVDRIVVGRFGDEEVVARRCSDDAVEIHCHGGRAAAAMIKETLVSAGCRRVAWRDWTAAQCEDPIAAAAIAALVDARTERTAAILLDQYHGALRRAIDDIRLEIERSNVVSAKKQIDAILARETLGQHLTRPWRVVLAGRANVGKSSLLNALTGYCRAIVHHAPGTTRDAVAVSTAIDGWPVELCDTAGLRTADDAVELAGIERTHERIAQADLVVLVADRSTPWSAEDQTLFVQWPNALLAHNKSDLPTGSDDRPAGLSISATRGDGLDALLATIARCLVPDSPPPGAAVPFSSEQAAAVRELLASVP